MTSTALAPSLADRSPGPRPSCASDGSEVDVGAAVLAYRAGDNQGLETLMSSFGRMMTSVARRYLRCQHDVDDAVQDAWVSFARAAHGIETPAAIGGWLRITTARAALTIAQRQRRCIPSEFPLEIGLPASEPDPVLLDNEVDAVRDAVARLQKQDRELISLLFEAQLTYAEVEARTGRPVGAIGPTRQRVMTKLRSDRAIRRLALDPAS